MTIEYRTATEEQKAVIEELLAAPFPATLETIAARLDLTPLAAAQILGRDMCSFVTGDVTERFDEVWASLAQWERATLFIQHGGHVFEIEAKLSAGKRAQGYYNILHSAQERRSWRSFEVRRRRSHRLCLYSLYETRIALRDFLRQGG